MAAKYGTPYFSNYVNSDMKPSDIRSMAILPTQEVIFERNGDNYIYKDEIQNLVTEWLSADDDNKPHIKMLMNGDFVDVTDMFQIPYDKYDTYVEIELENGYKQAFSYDHKCIVMRNGEIIDVRSQNVKPGDQALIAKYPYKKGNVRDTETYDLGYVAGLFFTHGYRLIGIDNVIRLNISDDLLEIVERVFEGFNIDKMRINEFYVLTISGKDKDPYDVVSKFVDNRNDGSVIGSMYVKDTVLNENSMFRHAFLNGMTDFSTRNFQLMFRTDNEMDITCMKNLIAIAASVGENFDIRKEETESDKTHYIMDNLKVTTGIHDGNIYDILTITNVREVPSTIDYVYNFTVNTPEHLYTLPNGMITHQCCRLRLDLTELRRKNGGFFGSGESTGSIGVVTINLPKLAYESNSEAEFYQRLDHVMDIAARSLDTKRKVVTKLLDNGFYPYTKRYLGHFDNHFSTIGLVGMNEAGLNAKWIQAGMDDPRTQKWAEEMLNHMRDRLIIYQQEYGALFNLESTPAESTAYRFAKHDKERYPDIKTANEHGTPYYTNSTNLPVGYTEDVFESLDIQDNLQILYTSGTVFHAFLGEKLPSWESAAKLVKTICDNYRLPYITLSPTYSICKNHGYITGEVYKCPDCGEETEVYSRITGYYRPIKNWNDGKAQEFKDRKEYVVEKNDMESREIKQDDVEDNEVPDLFDLNIETPTFDQDILLTTPTCLNCKIVKAYIQKNHLHVKELDATDGEGRDIANEYGLFTAPSLITMYGVVINKVPEILSYLKGEVK